MSSRARRAERWRQRSLQRARSLLRRVDRAGHALCRPSPTGRALAVRKAGPRVDGLNDERSSHLPPWPSSLQPAIEPASSPRCRDRAPISSNHIALPLPTGPFGDAGRPITVSPRLPVVLADRSSPLVLACPTQQRSTRRNPTAAANASTTSLSDTTSLDHGRTQRNSTVRPYSPSLSSRLLSGFDRENLVISCNRPPVE